MARKNKKTKMTSIATPAPKALMFGSGYSGADFNPQQGLIYWPSLDSRQQAPLTTLSAIWRKARALEANSGLAAQAVDICPRLLGWLMPRPCTKDLEWNKEALSGFNRIAGFESIFDRAGELNYKTAQLFINRACALDGDSLTVLTETGFGAASFQFYEAPQICSPEKKEGWVDGVKVDKDCRAIAYGIKDFETGKVTVIKRENAFLYKFLGARRQVRGLSGLHRSINHLIDTSEILRDTKTGVKLGAALGLVRTQQKEQGRTGMMGNISSNSSTTEYHSPEKIEDVIFGGQVVTLAPGQDVKALMDQRPSPNVMNLIQHLMSEIAFGIGLPPEVVWNPAALSSSGMRFILDLLKRWMTIRHERQRQWCAMVYRYVIAKEIARGTLRRCNDSNWQDVTWVPLPDLTIDKGRVGNLQIDLTAAGMADLDSWWLATEGITYEEAMGKMAYNIANAKKIAEENGLTLEELVPGRTRSPLAASSNAVPSPIMPDDMEPDTPAK